MSKIINFSNNTNKKTMIFFLYDLFQPLLFDGKYYYRQCIVNGTADF